MCFLNKTVAATVALLLLLCSAQTSTKKGQIGYLLSNSFQPSSTKLGSCTGAVYSVATLLGNCTTGQGACSGKFTNCKSSIKQANTSVERTTNVFYVTYKEYSTPNCARGTSITGSTATSTYVTNCVSSVSYSFVPYSQFTQNSFPLSGVPGFIQKKYAVDNSTYPQNNNTCSTVATTITYNSMDYCFGPYTTNVNNVPTPVHYTYFACFQGYSYTVVVYDTATCPSMPTEIPSPNYLTTQDYGTKCWLTNNPFTGDSYFLDTTCVGATYTPSLTPTFVPSYTPSSRRPSVAPSKPQEYPMGYVITSTFQSSISGIGACIGAENSEGKLIGQCQIGECSGQNLLCVATVNANCASTSKLPLTSNLATIYQSSSCIYNSKISYIALSDFKASTAFTYKNAGGIVQTLYSGSNCTKDAATAITYTTNDFCFGPYENRNTVSTLSSATLIYISYPECTTGTHYTINIYTGTGCESLPYLTETFSGNPCSPTTSYTATGSFFAYATTICISPAPSVSPTAYPSMKPSPEPTISPSVNPSGAPTMSPSSSPSFSPTKFPTNYPTVEPSVEPSTYPSVHPSYFPSLHPTLAPSSLPSIRPSPEPSAFPSVKPSLSPSFHPSKEPSLFPSLKPSPEPSFIPSRFPTIFPTSPTAVPSFTPIGDPTVSPSLSPSIKPSFPTINPTAKPTIIPTSATPSLIPSFAPTTNPSTSPSSTPTAVPSSKPSQRPSSGPTASPTETPSATPSLCPTLEPTIPPSFIPSVVPSIIPTPTPSIRPSTHPSNVPSCKPSKPPSHFPSNRPSGVPSLFPSQSPTTKPTTVNPTQFPSIIPSLAPSTVIPSTPTPTFLPSNEPSTKPSMEPSKEPTVTPTLNPSFYPTIEPSFGPTVIPTTIFPTSFPSTEPTTTTPSSPPTSFPSIIPSEHPSVFPSIDPSEAPTIEPSELPSMDPSVIPTCNPSSVPSKQPSNLPSYKPSRKPSAQPTLKPSTSPSFVPTRTPSVNPSKMPSVAPSIAPTFSPSTEPSYEPTQLPSTIPSSVPSSPPSLIPPVTPTSSPTTKPSQIPSLRPSREPSYPPSCRPSKIPSISPTCIPSIIPSSLPSTTPSISPTFRPSYSPSIRPSIPPSTVPSTEPRALPSKKPSKPPTSTPSVEPSTTPCTKPTVVPSWRPSSLPSVVPTANPSSFSPTSPSTQSSTTPSARPTVSPSFIPSSFPSLMPLTRPSTLPFALPSTEANSIPTTKPAVEPSTFPSWAPSGIPSNVPSVSSVPTPMSFSPTITITPTASRSKAPSLIPTPSPSVKSSSLSSTKPSKSPTALPSIVAGFAPTTLPSLVPSNFSSGVPSKYQTLSPSTSSQSYTLMPSAVELHLSSFAPAEKLSVTPSTIPSTFSTLGTTQHFIAPSNNPSLSHTVAPHHFPSLPPAVPINSGTPISNSLTIPSLYPAAVLSTSPPPSPMKSTRVPSIYSTSNPTSLPSVALSLPPSIAPSAHIFYSPSTFPSFVSTNKIIPADIPLPLLSSSTYGSLFASSPACSGSSCVGSLGQLTPASSSYIEAQTSTHHYLNASTFSSIYYEFGLFGVTPSALLTLGGLTIASVSGSFSTPPCRNLTIIVKTPVVYVDDSTVAAVYSAIDFIGRLQCSYSSVKMTINNGTTVLGTGSCTQSTNPTGKCIYSGSHSSLFNGDTLTVVLTMSTTVSKLIAFGSVLFSATRTNPSTYENLRGYVFLPQSKVFPGDTITASIIIYSASAATSIGSCSILVNFNSSQVVYISNSATSVLYNPVVDTGVGYVHIVYGPDKATDVTGVGLVSIGSIQFSVRTAISESTTSLFSGQLQSLGGVHGTSICESKYTEQSCSSKNMNYGNYFTGSTADLFYLDMAGDPGHTPGHVVIDLPSVVGLYATSSYSTMVNTARMNGVYPSDVMTVYATYGTSRSSWPDISVPASKLSCAAISNQPKAVLKVSPNNGGNGCKIQATTGGSSAYFVQASYAGSIVVGTYRVYYPLNFTVVATRRTLRTLSSCPTFESSVVKVLASLYLESTNFMTDVDVTSLLSLDTSDHAIATYTSASNLLTGKGFGGSSGMFKLITTGSSSSVTLINPDFMVSSQTAKIIGLYTYAYSSVQATLSTLFPAEIGPVPAQMSVSILLPSLNGQTIFSSNIPQSNYAKLVTFALADDGYFTDVSQYPGLSFQSLDSTNVNVSSSGAGSNFFWFAYVPRNAEGTSGNLIIPELRDNCNNILSHNSAKQGYIFTTSGTPTRASLTAANSRLSKKGGCATIAPLNIPYYTQLTAKLYLTYPTATVDMTTDSRTKYSYNTATAGVNITVSPTGYIQVHSPSKSGAVDITVTFPGFRGASSIAASITIQIVDIIPSIRIHTVDYPGGTVSPFITLKQIGCSGVFQRASLSATTIMTDNYAVDVTSATTFSLSSPFKLLTLNGIPYETGPGPAIVAVEVPQASTLITAKFCSSSGNFTIESGGMASVASLSGLQYGSQSPQQPIGQGCATSVYTVSTSASIGCGASLTQGCKPSSLQIHLSDSTRLQYSDLSKIGLYPGKLLNFNTTDINSIGVNSSTGALTALRNSYQYASVNVNSVCYSNLTTFPVHTSAVNVAANLYPIDNDVKFGYTLGLPYVQCPNSKFVSIPGYFRVPSGFYLEAWDVTLYYRGNYLTYYSTVYDTSGGLWSPLEPPTVSILSTDSSISYVHLFSNAYTTSSTSTEGNGQLVHIAELSFQTSSTSIISELIAIVTGLYYNPISSTSLASKVSQATSTTSFYCTSCAGFIKVNDGEIFDTFSSVRHHRELSKHNRRLKIPLNFNQLVTGDVDGNGLCGSEDYIESLTLYALPMYWTTQQLTVLEARSAGLSLNYLSHCTTQYCGNGNYTVPFLMSNLVLVDSAASLNSYAREFPIMQFLQSQTPCDIVTQLPTNSDPVMKIQVVLYSPKVDNSGFTGVPVICGAHTNVYFEVNFPHDQIAGLIDGGLFQSNNSATTVIGPAECLGNGVFTVAIKVFSVIPSSGYYAVGIGVNSTFGNTNTQAAYYNIQFPRLYSGATKFDPLYNSNNCAAAPVAIPTMVPSLPVIVKAISPSGKPIVSTSTSPSIVNTSSAPTISPTEMPIITPSTSPSSSFSSTPSIWVSTPIPITFNPFNMPSLVPSLFTTSTPTLNEVFLLPTFVPSVNHSSSIPMPSTTSSPLIAKPTVAPSEYNSIFPTTYSQLLSPSTSPTTNPFLPSSIPQPMPSVTPNLFLSPTWKPILPVSNIPSILTNMPPSVFSSSPTTATPTTKPSASPIVLPSAFPTVLSTFFRSATPTAYSSIPTTKIPSVIPYMTPSAFPTDCPSVLHTNLPDVSHTKLPTNLPSLAPTILPSTFPTIYPSLSPTDPPSASPTVPPSVLPNILPTKLPSILPTVNPIIISSIFPTDCPSIPPSNLPSVSPTMLPTNHPSGSPTLAPTYDPSTYPSLIPTLSPSVLPTNPPTTAPSMSSTTSAPSFSPHAQVKSFEMCGVNYRVDISLIGVTGQFAGSISFLNATIAQFTQSASSAAFINTIECILPADNLLSLPTISMAPIQSATSTLTIVVQFAVTFTVPSSTTVTVSAIAENSATIPNGIDSNVYAYYNKSSHDILKAVSSGNFTSTLHNICVHDSCGIKSALPIKTSASVGTVTILQSKSIDSTSSSSSSDMALEIAVPIAVVCGLAIIFTIIMLFYRRDICTRTVSNNLQGKEFDSSSSSNLNGPKELHSNPLRDSFVERNTFVDRSQDENFLKTLAEGFSFDRLYPSRSEKKSLDTRPSLDGRGSLIGFGSKPTDFRPSFV